MISKVKDLLQTRIIEPIKAQCPDIVPMDAYLQLIFNIHRRGISRYRAIGAITIPGLYCVNGTIPTQGYGGQLRKVGNNKHVWVRHDEDLNSYQVEYRGHVFVLTPDEWAQFRPSLAVAGDNVEV